MEAPAPCAGGISGGFSRLWLLKDQPGVERVQRKPGEGRAFAWALGSLAVRLCWRAGRCAVTSAKRRRGWQPSLHGSRWHAMPASSRHFRTDEKLLGISPPPAKSLISA